MIPGIGIALLAAVLSVEPVAFAQAAAPPGLSVSIQGDRETVASGDQLAYTATVRNDGTTEVSGRLVVTVPGYVTITDADDAESPSSEASWAVTVPAGGQVSDTLTVAVGDIPDGELRVTTLADFYLGDATQATIRSADAAAIAGVTDPAHAAEDQAAAPAGPEPIVWVSLGSAVAVGAGLLTWRMLLRRRRDPSAAPASRI